MVVGKDKDGEIISSKDIQHEAASQTVMDRLKREGKDPHHHNIELLKKVEKAIKRQEEKDNITRGN